VITHPARRLAASIKKPIHNVKDEAKGLASGKAGTDVFIEETNAKGGGAYRDRTDDPLLAKQVLSQLS
jgi:hypothetical protein